MKEVNKMDWLKEILETFLAPTLGTVIVYIIAKVGGAVVAFIKAQIGNINNAAIQSFVRVAAGEVVLYIQQKYAELSNTEKFDLAVEKLETKIDNFTESIKLGREIVSKEDVEVAIEAAIKSLKDNWSKNL